MQPLLRKFINIFRAERPGTRASDNHNVTHWHTALVCLLIEELVQVIIGFTLIEERTGDLTDSKEVSIFYILGVRQSLVNVVKEYSFLKLVCASG